jgi:hypothetical protein
MVPYQGEPVMQVKFCTYDLTDDPNTTNMLEWTVNPTVAKQVLKCINDGYLVLNITKYETSYNIE